MELQNRLPKARVVYASATGASEPKNMAYMTRLGLWGPGTPFNEFNDFINAVEKRLVMTGRTAGVSVLGKAHYVVILGLSVEWMKLTAWVSLSPPVDR